MIIKVLKSSSIKEIDIAQDHKKLSYDLSRRCLLLALQELKNDQTLKLADIEKIHNHYALASDPQVVVSLTHTKNFAAAICSFISQYKSVGIDCENMTRQMNPKSAKYFVNPKDDNQDDLLKNWTQKEAVFKAISPLKELHEKQKDVLVLSDIYIQKENFYLNWIASPLGKIKTYNEGEFLVSYALLD